MIPKAPKLVDCSEHGARSELFVVEGDSAARTIQRVRNPCFQAILPMQGKPMNAMKVGLDAVCKNDQFAALISAMGIEPTHGPNLASMRYQRIILLFDPDADGIHSRTLMLLFFYRWLSRLLEAGRIFDTYAPLWAINSDQLARPAYAYTQQQFDTIRARLIAEGIERAQTTRYRGLSSVGGDVLSKLCVHPETRRLSALAPDDAERALEMFEQMRNVLKK
jgi:DNA gyrase subunit B